MPLSHAWSCGCRHRPPGCGCHSVIPEAPRWPPHREAGFAPVWQSLPAPWCQACLGHSSVPLAVLSPSHPGEVQQGPRGGVGWEGHSAGCRGAWLLSLTHRAVLSHPSRALSVPQEAKRLDRSAGSRLPAPITTRFKVTK